MVLDFIRDFLEMIGKYGIDRVFLVWFFILYLRSQRRNEKLQDARLADSKEALGTLIEVKVVLDLMEKQLEEIEQEVKAENKGKND